MGLVMTAALGCGTSSCIRRGTRVATPDGERAIEELDPGDEVWSWDLEAGRLVACQIRSITRSRRECIALTAGPVTLECTTDHPVYGHDAAAYQPAAELLRRRGRLLVLRDGSARPRALEDGRTFVAVDDVYDLALTGTHHNFFAGGVLVHNKDYVDTNATTLTTAATQTTNATGTDGGDTDDTGTTGADDSTGATTGSGSDTSTGSDTGTSG
jgi:hypothetical protein